MKPLFLFALLLLLPALLFAQQEVERNNNTQNNEKGSGFSPSFSFAGQISFPEKEFKTALKSVPIGYHFALSLPVSQVLPIEAGFSFSGSKINSKEQEIYLSEAKDLTPDGTLQISGKSNSYHLLGRLKPFKGRIRPYADVIGGFRHYIKTSAIEISNPLFSNSGEDILNTNFVFSGGWALGLQYRIIPGIFIEGRFEKLIGGVIDYVDNQSLQLDSSGSLSHELIEAKSNQITGSLGLLISF